MSNKRFVSYDDTDTVSKYFKDIRKIDLEFKSKYKTEHLSLEEEVKLAKKILKGDQKAIDELVKANLRFVVSIVKPYQNCGLTLPDLINEGNIGLIKAAQKFDYTKGFRFISYAVWWVRQSILHSLNENARIVRLPTNVINKLHSLKKSIDKFETENEREPTIGELENLDKETIELLYSGKCASLNDPIGKDGEYELGDMIAHDENNDSEENKFFVDERVKVVLNETLKILSPREKDIIQSYYGINVPHGPMILEDIGIKYNLSKERVRQLKSKSLRKLKFSSLLLYRVLNE
jgi:RNA polymerase primary sigma factor